MAKGIVIPFTADPRAFIRGIKQIDTSLEDVKDALGDVEKAGDDALSGLDARDAERDLGLVEDAADDLKRGLDDVGDKAEDAEDAFARLGRGAKADMDKVGRSADQAERDVDDLTDEVSDSAKEFGSAFRGDPVEALEEVQSLVSELATKFIPGIGSAVVAIASGAAFSALIAFYDRWREEQEARRQQVLDWRDTVLDALGVVEKADIDQALKDALDKAGVSASEFEDILAAAPRALRVGFRQALQAGDLEALADIVDDVAAQADTINRRFVATGTSLTPGQQAILDMNTALGGTTGLLQDGVEQAQAWARIIGNDVTQAANDANDAIDYATRPRVVSITTGGGSGPGGVPPMDVIP